MSSTKSVVQSTHRIPFQDLGRLHASIGDELDDAIRDVVSRSAFVGAASCSSFEREFADAHEATGAAGCGSGTDALVLALRAVGIGPGDEVIVPAMTFVASAEAVVIAGATPVLADVDPTTLLLSAETVNAVRTESTRAVMPVHLYGHVVPFDLIENWRSQGLLVVEDAAQAHLGSWQGRMVGSAGHAACFSFYPGKNLGAFGDGGAVISDDSAVLARVATLRDHGRASKYSHDEIGMCSRLDGIQAAVLSVKLRHLAAWTSRRQRLAEIYADRLGSLLVPWEAGAVHHLLVARLEAGARDRVREAMTNAGVGVGVHYPLALSQQPSLAPWHNDAAGAEAAGASVLSLPMDPLMTAAEVEIVCDLLQDLL